MILQIYTVLHTLLSLVGIVTGCVVLSGLLSDHRLDGWTRWFLITTSLTSLTGFFFPFHGFTPAIAVGIISCLVLAVAIYARYPQQMSGTWRWIYVATAVLAFYLNFFVLVVMAFRHVPALHALAPQQTEPAFVQAQLSVLGLFLVLGGIALSRFHPGPRLVRA